MFDVLAAVGLGWFPAMSNACARRYLSTGSSGKSKQTLQPIRPEISPTTSGLPHPGPAFTEPRLRTTDTAPAPLAGSRVASRKSGPSDRCLQDSTSRLCTCPKASTNTLHQSTFTAFLCESIAHFTIKQTKRTNSQLSPCMYTGITLQKGKIPTTSLYYKFQIKTSLASDRTHWALTVSPRGEGQFHHHHQSPMTKTKTKTEKQKQKQKQRTKQPSSSQLQIVIQVDGHDQITKSIGH